MAAVLVAATKYYDLHKARAGALKPGVSLEAPAAQPEKLGTEPNPMATAQPSKIEPKANGKAAGGWEKVFPIGMYEGNHTYARGGTPTEYAVQLRDDGTCRRVTLGKNVSEQERIMNDKSARLKRITIEPGKCGGRPSLRGTRMRVVDVLELLGAGADHAEILRDYPSLELDDILACLEYAARQTDHVVLLSA